MGMIPPKVVSKIDWYNKYKEGYEDVLLLSALLCG